jgi:hypothetical protein
MLSFVSRLMGLQMNISQKNLIVRINFFDFFYINNIFIEGDYGRKKY